MAREGVFTLKVGEVDDWAVGFAARLASGETLKGTPQVTIHKESGDKGVFAGITASNAARNTESLTDASGVEHAADEAVEFRVTAAGDATAGRYTLRVECPTTTDRSPVETFPLVLDGPPEA